MSNSNSAGITDSLSHRRCGLVIVFIVFASTFFISNTYGQDGSSSDDATVANNPTATDSSAATDYVPLTTGEKAATFGKRIIAFSSFAKSAFGAGISQWKDSPEEWGQGMAGYGRRYGHKLANRAVENGIGFLVAGPLGQDPRYFHSEKTGIFRRTAYALESTILTRNDQGGKELSVWRFAGNYGAQFVSNTWRPERYHDVSDTLVRGTMSIGFDAATNVLKEFWPDIRRLFQ
jgi:hypothetical protein